MKKPLLSIVVIALNSEQTVERTLSSIKKQRMSDFECICVDDGSIDKTTEIFNRYHESDPRFKTIIHSGNKGCIASRYDGLIAAKGKYILFIDSDDSYEKDAFEILCKKMYESDLDVCEFGVNTVFKKDNNLNQQQIKEFTDRYKISNATYNKTEDILQACFLKSDIKVNVWNKIYKTRLVKKALADYDSEMIIMEEDWLFSFAVLSLAKKYETISNKLINYSIGSGLSTSSVELSNPSVIQHASVLRVYKIIENCVTSRSIEAKVKKEVLDSIHTQIIRFAVNDFANFCSINNCQLFLDTLLQYCDINEFLITFSIMASEGKFLDIESSINKLRFCQLPSDETKDFVNSLSLYEIANNIKKIDQYYKKTTTWCVGRFVTFIPRYIKDFLINKGAIKNNDEGIELEKISVSLFNPNMPITEMHNFFGLNSMLKLTGATIYDETRFLSLEYKRELKLLIVTDNYKGTCVQKTIDYCKKNNTYLTIIDFESDELKETSSNRLVNLILCKDLEKLSLTKFVDLYDGLIIDAKDYFKTIECMRCNCRNTLILTNRSIRVGLHEKYCLRKEYKLDKYFEWLIVGNLYRTDDLISVIIPTLNAGKEFDTLLNTIENQKYIAKPEIIIIDSGSTDSTLAIAKKHKVKTYTIAKEDFSHSKVRNMGADLANGEYLLFTTQDAIPSSNMTYCRMLNEMYINQVSALSPAEEYRKDADLYAKMMIYEYKFEYFYNSQVDTKIGDKNLEYFEMRRSSSLDDVMCLTKKSIFKNYYYRFSYAEDCDYGYRLIKDGYSIEKTNKIKVIHSHTRPADYFFKRSIVDILSMKKIYKNLPIPVGDYKVLCNRAMSLYALVEMYIENIRKNKKARFDYSQMRALSKECMRLSSSAIRKMKKTTEIDIDFYAKNNDSNVTNIICLIMPIIKHEKPTLQDLFTLEHYLEHIVWLKSLETEYFTDGDIEDICECLRKYVASQIGYFLGSYLYVHNGSCKRLDKVLNRIDLTV